MQLVSSVDYQNLDHHVDPVPMKNTDSTNDATDGMIDLDAMDATTYCKIIEKRGQDAYSKHDDHEYNDGIMSFRKDLLKFKVVWYNDWKKDWICWQRNNHALYSIFTVPKYHEYTARERGVTFVCASVIFSIAAVIAVIAEDGMNNSGESSLSIFLVVNGINLGGGITAGLVEGILRECATCQCAQGVENETVTKRMERLGHIFIGLYAISSVLACIGGAITASTYGLLGKYFLGWLTGIIAFLIVPTILLTVVFNFLWKKQTKEEQLGDDCPFMVSANEYNAFVNGNDNPRANYPNIDERKTRVMKIVKAETKNVDSNAKHVASESDIVG